MVYVVWSLWIQEEYFEEGLRQLCANDSNVSRLAKLSEQRLHPIHRELDRWEEEHFGDSDNSVMDQGSDEEMGEEGMDDVGEERMDEEDDRWEEFEELQDQVRPDVFNKPLYQVAVPLGRDALGVETHVVWDSQVNTGSAITNLMSWKQDHEVPEKAFNNLLHIVKALLPPSNRLPKTEATCCQSLCVEKPQQYQRHWCSTGSDGRGCDQYIYPAGKGHHLQFTRRRLAAGLKEGEAYCPKCKTPRFDKVGKDGTILQPRGTWYDLRADQILQRVFRRAESPLHDDYPLDTSINGFFQSAYGKQLIAVTQGAVQDPANVLIEVAADGVTVYKFKHHVTTVIAIRFQNVPPHRRGQRSNIEIIALVPGPSEPPDVSLFLQDLCNMIKDSQQPGGAMRLVRPATQEEVEELAGAMEGLGAETTPAPTLPDQQPGGSLRQGSQPSSSTRVVGSTPAAAAVSATTTATTQANAEVQNDGPSPKQTYDRSTRMFYRDAVLYLVAVHADNPGRLKLAGRGQHNSYFCCLWCLHQVRCPYVSNAVLTDHAIQ